LKKKQFSIEELRDVSRKHSMENNSANWLFYVYLVIAEDLLDHVSKSCKKEIIIHEARRNYLVNLATSLEVFCKRTIMQFSDCWDERGISELLQERITLHEAFELVEVSRDQKLAKELFIINSYSFSNFDSITLVFSKLTGKANLNILLGKTIKHDKWEKSLKELFRYRNEILHDGIDMEIETKVINRFTTLVTDYVESITGLVTPKSKRKG